MVRVGLEDERIEVSSASWGNHYGRPRMLEYRWDLLVATLDQATSMSALERLRGRLNPYGTSLEILTLGDADVDKWGHHHTIIWVRIEHPIPPPFWYPLID